ncbi:serine-rich adhesin for platelets isoform X3 [Magallana gigas]|uniref:serine-rich adhesin for platelets isoform X3 n=2 Tax=Magallana gigas TaxID=29159 RepID=UPI003341BA06
MTTQNMGLDHMSVNGSQDTDQFQRIRERVLKMAALPPMMGDLLEYFETRNHSLDKAEVNHSLCLDNKFTSAITFNGVPILPPVMTQKRKEEMAGYRRQAVQRETRRRTMQREQLVAKVQSIVSEVEEKRASSRGVSESTCSSPVGSDSAASVRASPAPSFKNSAPESTNTGSGAKSRLQDGGSSQPDTTSKSVHSKRERPETSRSQVSKKVEEKTVSAQKSEAKPNLSENNVKKKVSSNSVKPQTTEPVKEKSDSKTAKTTQPNSKSKQSQIPKPVQNQNQNKALSNLKRASSMSSLPNFAKIEGLPTPKPPTSPKNKQQLRRARLGLSGQYSISQPDLRDIDKSDSETSISSQSQVEETASRRRKRLLKSTQHSVSNPDLASAGLSPDSSPSVQEQKSKMSPKTKLSSSTSVPNLTLVGKSKKKKSLSQRDAEKSTAQNTQQKSQSKGSHGAKPKTPVPHSKPSQIKEDAKEERLDSLSDLTSLENCNSLPQEFAGMPLSSVRQQQISHVLAKLSQCLNIQDTMSTMNSTGSSGHDTVEIRQQITDQILASAGIQPGSVQAQLFLNQYNIQQEASENTADESLTSNTQNPSSHNSSAVSSEPVSSSSGGNRTQTSTASNSIMSSGGSASGGQQQNKRMSPKGAKSKVHFSSFLTEISTSASQSLEGRISVRKMDITPQNSPRVSVDTVDGLQTVDSQEKLKLKIAPKNSDDLGLGSGPQVSGENISEEPESMLSKVALSPETDESSPGTPKDIFSKGLPFHGYGNELEHNTSDKENEFKGKSMVGTSEGFVQTNVSSSSHVDTQGSVKESVRSDESSQCSTLKASQDLLKSRDSGFGNTKSSVSDSRSGSQASNAQKVLGGSRNTSMKTDKAQPSVTSSENLSSQHPSVSQHRPNTADSIYRVQTQGIRSKAEAKRAQLNSKPVHQASPAVVPAESHEFVTSRTDNKGPASRSAQRKLNMDAEVKNGYEKPRAQNISLDTSTEQEGKAEHIQKYLSQVQSQREASPVNTGMPSDMPPLGTPADITAAIQSFTSSLQSLESMSEEELIQIQAEHFDKIRKFLIEQQRQQLEELFVIQRREQMELQNDIASYQNNIKKQDFSNVSYLSNSTQLSQPNLQHSPENNAVYNSDPVEQPFNISHISHHGNTTGKDKYHDTVPKHYAYISSPSLYFNPKDRDNNSDISTFSRATPKQSLQFVNHSTPSPKSFKPLVHSPVKQPSSSRHSKPVRIPDRVFDDDLQPCFERVSAYVKGYLTRRLLKTEKVQEIVRTIQDTKQFAYSFQTETPIKRGVFSHQDRDLLDRIIAQLQAALLDIHEIFFEIPVHERMALIAHSRQLMEEKRLRDSNSIRASVSTSHPRISSATLKAMERKRKANDSEVSGNLRPQSAPAETPVPRHSSSHTANQSIDFSEPMRRHFQSLLSRALKPIQGQTTATNPARETSKSRPGVILSKPVSLAATKAKRPVSAGATVTGKTTGTSAKPSTSNVKAKAAAIKAKFAAKPASAWR